MGCRCRFHRKLKASGTGYFPDRTVYLDYNATAPVDPRVIGSFEAACRRTWGNPASLHAAGVEAWDMVEDARNRIGKLLSLDPEGIHFCSGGTEALHAGMFGYLSRRKRTAGNSSGKVRPPGIITSGIEHSALDHPVYLARKGEIPVTILPVDGKGKISPENISRSVREGDLIVLSPVNHETGGRQPLKEIFRRVDARGGVLLIDAVQAASRLSPDEWTPYCHMAAVSGHKLYAPKGTGFLYKRPGLRIGRFRFGGGQENGFFPGTENVPGIAALARALELMESERKNETAMLTTIGKETPWLLEKQGVEFILESPGDAVPGILNFSFPWIDDMEEFLYSLNEEKICVSRFSACTERVDGESRILLAMGRNRKRASSSLRVTFGRWSKREDIYTLARVLAKIQN